MLSLRAVSIKSDGLDENGLQLFMTKRIHLRTEVANGATSSDTRIHAICMASQIFFTLPAFPLLILKLGLVIAKSES